MVQGVNEQRSCTSCGQLVEGTRFCTNCGAAVSEAPAMPAPPTSPPPTQPVFVQTAPEPVAPPPAWTQPVQLPTAATQSAPQSAPPGPPSAPQPPRGPRWHDYTKVVWVLVCAALVLLVGGLAFALGTLSFGGEHHGVTPPKQVGDPTNNPSGSGHRSHSVAPGSPEGVARSISALMADSRMDKSEIGRAASDLSACRNIEAGAQTFDDAMKSRERLVQEARKVDASGLRGGQRVVNELTQAWSIAGDADAAYARWGRSVHRAHGKCVGDKAALMHATELSDRSHPHKQAAAKAWNAIAHKYGLPTVQWDQL